ncbi:ATP-binding cassette domain-containing protein [Bifidobacterium sp. ESL0682]|uniref:ATP-binding cassette domain-containing protein n=1 Tax=Bifidobacterium sp. ESL0682 TaxID=2983212 RepID=UPI0023F8FF03|nr:ATP-binding cassette domain-containing protein [Bifidobacterium sp. ESL0682]WEV42606.1 ATP-binding cassette domain-containing protein [Bifidobacterium sp. ESL0682]
MSVYNEVPLMSMHNVTVRFGFIEALKSVNFDIWPKEVVSIVGDNGAGKSTIIKLMAGLLQPSEGKLDFQGKPTCIHSIREANDLGIVSVFQGQEFCNNLDVSSNLFLGQELHDAHGMRDDMAMNTEARKILQEFDSPIRVGQPISSLSTGQQQTVALAKTMLNNPKLILLDEPTSSLSMMQTAEVLNYIKRLRSQTRSVVLVGHDLPDVFAVSDRIIVLRHGRIKGIHETNNTSYEEIIAEIAGVDGEISPCESEGRLQQYQNAVKRNRLIDRTKELQDLDDGSQ